MSGLVQCPFDPLHQIAPNKFGKHLTKCQRQHPDMQYARCPLNTFHLVKPEDLKEHVRTCPSRMELEAYKYSISSASTAPTEELIINTGDLTGAGSSAGAASLQQDEECWDDSNYEAYNPLGKCKQQKEQNKNFIIPCANKFVVPNVSAAMIKEEFQNDTVEERPAVKEEVLSEGDRSPSRCAIVVKEETPAIEPRAIKSEHSERQDQEPYRGRNYDARDRRSEGHMHQHYERRDRYSVGQRDNGSARERYQSNGSNTYGDRHMDRYDRKRDGNSSSRSHEEYRPRYNPYHNPYSQSMRQSRDEKTEASNRHFKIDRNERKH
uniref:CHHC U11-48K-type domain-containing protein n=1 Tax=Anopheles atroparvus TaxID=41427 RepID=A0AAG5DCR1_ANOAO